jgi:hypothetical protein
MAIVNERHNAAKPTQVDPKTGRPLPSSGPPRSTSPSLDVPSDNSGFFGSFFPRNKKKAAAMDAPPPQLKASGTLSEKEANEVEVISQWAPFSWDTWVLIEIRTLDHFVLQYHATYHDRYGAQSCYVESSPVSRQMILPGTLLTMEVGLPKMKCSENFSSTCIGRTSWRIYSKRATTPFAVGKNVCRW